MAETEQDWKALLKSFVDRHKGKAYAPILHPDYRHIPSSLNDKRFEMIKPHLICPGGTALDIGTHWGYFAWRLEQEGYRVTAVENDDAHFAVLKGLRDSGGMRFEVTKTSFLSMENVEYDVIFALNIWHHYLKTESRFESLKKFLKRLKTKLIIFEPHSPIEHQMRNAFRNLKPAEFTQFVAEQTGMSHIEFVGQDGKDRQIFKLTA
jgi:2-polyprenyl-3-methyl-5-hydroxy-6-metoxy-1,4-benzoquinol methylase